jgi:hypothetical protein
VVVMHIAVATVIAVATATIPMDGAAQRRLARRRWEQRRWAQRLRHPIVGSIAMATESVTNRWSGFAFERQPSH